MTSDCTSQRPRRCNTWLQAFLLGGPVGLFYALRLDALARRRRRLSVYIDREHDLHRSHIAALHHEQNQVIAQEQSLQIAAAQFRKHCDKLAAGVEP